MRVVERFIEFCNSPGAGFACFDFLDRNENLNYIARIKNLLQEGASPESLKKLSKCMEDPGSQVREFFSSVDGAFLFVDALGGNRPFELCSIPDWDIATHAMRKWYLAKDAEFDGNIDFLTDGYAIARISQTPDYISIVANGENAGKIYHVAHDDFKYEPMAHSFDEFIDRMIDDPVAFLNDVGALAHYADGESDTLWVPKRYLVHLDDAQ